MKILRTYARLFVEDTGAALPFYESLVGRPADVRFAFEAADIASVGHFLVVGGPPEATAGYRDTVGPVVVEDLDDALVELRAAGAEVADGPRTSATGVFCYVVHPDGTTVEYVQWTDDLVARIL